MRNACGPVTAAKSIYEDDQGYLIMVSLPFVDQQRVKVSWRNTLTHGIVKIVCVSTARMQHIRRHGRMFALADPFTEHCPPGDFIREIPLATRIPEDAKLEACFDEAASVLEIMVPKRGNEPEEHEVSTLPISCTSSWFLSGFTVLIVCCSTEATGACQIQPSTSIEVGRKISLI
jgi:HSP20 family molecular chaperone IbpA